MRAVSDDVVRCRASEPRVVKLVALPGSLSERGDGCRVLEVARCRCEGPAEWLVAVSRGTLTDSEREKRLGVKIVSRSAGEAEFGVCRGRSGPGSG